MSINIMTRNNNVITITADAGLYQGGKRIYDDLCKVKGYQRNRILISFIGDHGNAMFLFDQISKNASSSNIANSKAVLHSEIYELFRPAVTILQGKSAINFGDVDISGFIVVGRKVYHYTINNNFFILQEELQKYRAIGQGSEIANYLLKKGKKPEFIIKELAKDHLFIYAKNITEEHYRLEY